MQKNFTIRYAHPSAHKHTNPISIGLEIPEFWGKTVARGHVHLQVRGEQTELPFTLNQLKVQGTEYSNTFTTKLDLSLATEAHGRRLPMNGFGSMLSSDYAEACEEAFKQWAPTQGLRLVRIHSHWPTFQACLELPKLGEGVQPVQLGFA